MCKQASPVEPKTLGEHVRRRRLQLHLFQADLAKLFGVDIASVRNWEQGVFEPAKAIEPRIIAWLGYDPKSR
jgi:DNA-binding transcriptional regulator YiaG